MIHPKFFPPISKIMLLSEWNGEAQDINDLARKFNNTFVLGSISKGKEQVLNIISFGTNSRGVAQVNCGTSDGKIFSTVLSEVDITRALPEPGVYSLNDDGIAIVRRIPARQWQEGLYLGNTLILINGETRVMRNVGWDLALNLYKAQEDIPFRTGLERVRNGKCLRLNRNYWLKAGSKRGESIHLMRRHTAVGTMAAGAFFFSPAAKILKEELKDELGFHA